MCWNAANSQSSRTGIVSVTPQVGGTRAPGSIVLPGIVFGFEYVVGKTTENQCTIKYLRRTSKKVLCLCRLAVPSLKQACFAFWCLWSLKPPISSVSVSLCDLWSICVFVALAKSKVRNPSSHFSGNYVFCRALSSSESSPPHPLLYYNSCVLEHEKTSKRPVIRNDS